MVNNVWKHQAKNSSETLQAVFEAARIIRPVSFWVPRDAEIDAETREKLKDIVKKAAPGIGEANLDNLLTQTCDALVDRYVMKDSGLVKKRLKELMELRETATPFIRAWQKTDRQLKAVLRAHSEGRIGLRPRPSDQARPELATWRHSRMYDVIDRDLPHFPREIDLLIKGLQRVQRLKNPGEYVCVFKIAKAWLCNVDKAPAVSRNEGTGTGSRPPSTVFQRYVSTATPKKKSVAMFYDSSSTTSAAGYHKTASIDTFMATTISTHPTDLAGLAGARLVTSLETGEGRRWAESKIKGLTGGDQIAARFMRRDFFEFTPIFKLIIAGNHKPALRSVDEAMRRRLHLIPFEVTIPPDQRDKKLREKLRAEWPGILQWMVDGSTRWQENGLSPPKAVYDATNEYLATEDSFAAWINDRCEVKDGYWASSSDLFASWRGWAEAAGESVGSQKNFGQKLQGRGFVPKSRGKENTRGYEGLQLRK
jgi:hypothetical protein